MAESQLQLFLISEFKSGINIYLEPWIRPQDAFDPLINAYVYRGVLSRRAGTVKFGNQLADHNPVMGIMQWIDQSSGTTKLVVASTTRLYVYDPVMNVFNVIGPPPTFTGNITNFFNFTNWEASVGAPSYLYMVNNKDNIARYDGTNYTSLVPVIDGSGTTITTALDVQVYKNRLLLIRPTLSSGGIQNQSIYWSALQNPTNTNNGWRTDIAGQGGFLAAATGDQIIATEIIRDVLVVFFTNSTWIFRYTGNETSPFRWDKINNTKSNNCPYGTADYDERATSIGSKGMIACDAVNVQRFDIPIVDYYEDTFAPLYYSQAFSQRFDNLNQTWTLYVSSNANPTNFPLVGGIAPGSDSALIYNFIENTWATYTWSVPTTCLGPFVSQTGDTWQAETVAWDKDDFSWDSFSNQQSEQILLMGDTSGNLYQVGDPENVTDNGSTGTNGVTVIPDIVTTKWNPTLGLGQKVQFVYIDVYYTVVSTDPANPISVSLNFYVDNSSILAAQRTLTLDGPTGSQTYFKRIYINLIGEFIQMEIDPNTNAIMSFLGFILWVRPAGRLTP